MMEIYQIKIIETIIVVVLVFIIRIIVKISFEKARDRYNFQKDRVKFTAKLINISIYLSAIIITLFIWGVNQNELALFLSSFIAVLGIGLFAQWSILSNITASILLFINHPAKIGDTILVLDKDFPLTGKIKDIGAFFISIKTETNQIVTIPNSLLFQKMVKIIVE